MGTQGESGRAAAVVYSRAKQWIDMSHYTTIDAANILERPLGLTDDWQEMELKRRECLTTAVRQKREMIQQHHIDTR